MERKIKKWNSIYREWNDFPCHNLKKLDIVVLFEPDGTPVNFGQVYILLGNALQSEETIWGFSCLPVDGCTYENCKKDLD